MKKVLSIFLLLAVVLTVGACGIIKPSPEKALLGKWDYSTSLGTANVTFGSIEFKEGGVMSAQLIGLINVDGNYVITEQEDSGSLLSITYTALGISYTVEYNYTVSDTTLQLTPTKANGITLNYTKAAETENTQTK